VGSPLCFLGQSVARKSPKGGNIAMEREDLLVVSEIDEVKTALAQMRSNLWNILGRSGEEDVSLTSNVLQENRKAQYIVYDLLYRSGEKQVPAYLLQPRNQAKKTPGLVVIHCNASDYSKGRAKVMGEYTEHDSGLAAELVKGGFAVLAVELVGFGSRQVKCHPHHLGKRLYQLAERKENEVGMFNTWSSLLVQGKTLLGENLRELQNAISVLQQSENVDPACIGTIGHSGGGIHSLFLTALDQRIKVGVSVCAVSSTRQKMENGVKLDDTLVIPRMTVDFGDLDQVLLLTAGRKFLAISAEDDCYSLGAKEMMAKALKRLPSPLRTMEHVSFPGSHRFSREMREKAYAFLHRHLS
jgi:dienelactone hydrolase